MKAIQLDLFSGKVMATTTPAIEIESPCPRNEASGTMIANCCKACPLHDLCDIDECAAHLFDLDDAERNYEPFGDWLTDSWD